MKTTTKIIAVLSCLLLAHTVSAQKLAHINSQELLVAMPETDSAQKQLEKIAMEHDLALEEMSVEFNKKMEDYNAKYNEMSDLVKASKEAELQDLQKRVQAFQQTAEQDLQNQRMKLFQPIQEKAVKAVNDVSKEKGFTYVFDTATGVVVYMGDDAVDILPLVKAKLGIN